MRIDLMLRIPLRVLAVLVCLITTGSHSLSAQEPPPKQPAPKAWERLIYLPYQNLSTALSQQQATVLLPYKEYLEMWDALLKSRAEPAQSIDAVISQADYSARIENNLARIEATFLVKVIGKPWSRIPLKFGDAAVGRLTTTNDQIVLIGTGEGTYDLVLPSTGDHQVKLELMTRVRTSSEGKSFDLEVPLVGISNLELTIPSPDQTVDVVPHLTSLPQEADANSTRISASLGSTNHLTARWFPRVSQSPEMELLTSVSSQLHARVADGLVQTEAVLNYQVLRGELTQATIGVPLEHRIIDVTAPNLKGWKAATETGRQVITVDLLGSSAKSVAVEVRTERPVGSDVLELGGIQEDGQFFGIHAIGAVRESGVIVASHSPELALAIEHQKGLFRIEASEVPEPLRRADNLYFKFYNPQFQLAVTARPVEPRVAVLHRSILEIDNDQLRLSASLKYTVERAGIFSLKFQVPEGLTIDQVDSDKKQEFTLSADGQVLTLTLNQKTEGAFQVDIKGHQALTNDASSQPMLLPILEPLEVTREQGTVSIYTPEAIEVAAEEKGLVAVQPDRNPELDEYNGLQLASAWTYNRRPVAIPVVTVRKPTRLSSEVASSLNVTRETLEVESVVNFDVAFAGVDTFRLAVPEAVSSRVQIEPDMEITDIPLKQRNQGEAKDGWVIWTLITQREVTGRYAFRVKYDVNLTKQERSATVKFQPVNPLGLPGPEGQPDKVPLVSLSGTVAVSADRIWSLSATPTELQTIDVRELASPTDQTAALAYRYTRPTAGLGLTATEYEVQEVVQTVISRALVETVLTQDDTVTYRCRFKLKTSERQRLPLELPNKVQPLGVMVAGKQVSLERSTQPSSSTNTEMYYINVARAGRSDEAFTITLVYRIPSFGLQVQENVFGSALNLYMPRLGDADIQDSVAVQHLRAVVWVPEFATLVGTPSHFTPVTRVSLWRALRGQSPATTAPETDHWIGDNGGGLFEFPTAGHAFVFDNLGGTPLLKLRWWRTSWIAAAWTLGFLAVALLLRPTSSENKLAVLLIGSIAVAVFALNDPDQAMFVVRSSRYGIGLLIGIWLIHLLLYRSPHGHPPAAEATPAPYAAVIPPPGIFDDVMKRLQP